MTNVLWSNTHALRDHRNPDHESCEEMLVQGGGGVQALRVRYKIHHDTSYPHQSSARVEVWSAIQGWTEIDSLFANDWADDTKPLDGATEGLYAALDELRSRARTILRAIE